MKNLLNNKLLSGFALLLLLKASVAASCTTAPTPAVALLANELGWQTAPISLSNLCGGFYVEPQLSAFNQPIEALNQSTTSFTFDEAIYNQNEPSVLTGDVVVIQSGRRLEADKAVLYHDPKTGKLTAVDLYGHVKVYEPGRLMIANHVHLNMNDQTGAVHNVIYRVLLAPDTNIPELEQPFQNNMMSFSGTTAWGRAALAEQVAPGVTYYQRTTYTTCAPTANQWVLHAEKIKIDKNKGRGVAKNVVMKIKDFPIFYTPYLSFPTNKNRKTGFLFPLFSHTSASGYSFALPFYWNIAPNYDATITPKIYTRRGLLTDTNFRYLTNKNDGNFTFAFIPADREFKNFQASAGEYSNQFGYNDLMNDSDNRGMFSWQNNTTFDQHWTSNINFAQVSDDYFLQDFGDIPSEISTNQILRQGSINYSGTNWNFAGIFENYQTLNPVNRQPITTLYSRLPELDLNANYPGLPAGLDFSVQNQIVYFTREIGPTDTSTPPRGERVNFQPELSLPIQRASGFFIPSLQFIGTAYNLSNQPNGFSDNITRAIPIFDIDSGLYFDRDVNFAKYSYDQTLEPRIFYLYAPYENQNDIPIFDSALVPFNYNALFLTNRFSGGDRIGDANQISLGLTSRLLDQTTGAEKFHISIGQIYYFRNREVTVCNTPGCTDFLSGLGANSNTEKVSPFASQMTYYLTPFWSSNGDLAWDPSDSQFDTGDYYIQYQPNPNVVFNFGYSFLRNGNVIDTVPADSSQNNLSLATTSMAIPLSYRWSTLAMYSYNISQHQTQSYLAGLQYNTCCYAMRVMGGRIFTALDQNGNPTYNTGFYVQLEFKGLANFDPTNASSLLASTIPGYQDPFATTPGIT